jgi:hypothetical protein
MIGVPAADDSSARQPRRAEAISRLPGAYSLALRGSVALCVIGCVLGVSA